MEPLLFQQHFAYNRWATQRLLHAVDSLSPDQLHRDFGTADKSILGTMLHLFRSERLWLQRLKGTLDLGANPVEAWALRIEWPDLHAEWSHWAGTLTREQLLATVEYRDSKGNAQANVLWEIILHVVNHSTHHRGQVCGFLRSLGAVPPPLDYILFVRELQHSQP